MAPYPAIVIAVLAELGGTTYHVRYWHNGDAKTVWLTAGELLREVASPRPPAARAPASIACLPWSR